MRSLILSKKGKKQKEENYPSDNVHTLYDKLLSNDILTLSFSFDVC